MKHEKRSFLKALAMTGASLPFLPLAVRQALARNETGGYPRLMEGPMIGAVNPTSARLWMRASGQFPVAVSYGLTPDLKDAKMTAPINATPDNDYVTQFLIEGLQPNTTYYYRAYVAEKPSKYLETVPGFRFRTAPKAGQPSRFRIGFGSCCRWQGYPRQPIWEALQLWEPDAFFWLGDNIYADTIERSIFADFYKVQRSLPEFQPFGRRVPQLATWDDHDYGLNNHDRENPAREDAYDMFRRFWANPAYGTDDTKGVFFHYAYGGVDFYFLDNRYHRTPNSYPDNAEKTMLGEGQKAWLKQHLKQSKAPFKVLIAGGGWSHSPGQFGSDRWTSYLNERNEIFNFIRDEGISGVILLSGDMHRAEANCIPWSEEGGYDLYEMVSSALAQDIRPPDPDPANGPEIRVRAPATAHNAGILDFDLTLKDPVVRFNTIKINGDTFWDTLEIRASELRNGVSSWQQKVDPKIANPKREA